jgi:hypothetical protein
MHPGKYGNNALDILVIEDCFYRHRYVLQGKTAICSQLFGTLLKDSHVAVRFDSGSYSIRVLGALCEVIYRS